MNPDLTALSVHGLEGSVAAGVHNYGDTDHRFTVQSCGKVFTYIAARMYAEEDATFAGDPDAARAWAHTHVAFEPSGKAFNEACLTADGRARVQIFPAERGR